MRKREVERTCKRDGTVWYVSMRERKERAPGRTEMFAAKLNYTGADIRPFGRQKALAGASTQLLALNAKTERVRRNTTCPTCSSSSYAERVVYKVK
jgi:hypothetical protein